MWWQHLLPLTRITFKSDQTVFSAKIRSQGTRLPDTMKHTRVPTLPASLSARQPVTPTSCQSAAHQASQSIAHTGTKPPFGRPMLTKKCVLINNRIVAHNMPCVYFRFGRGLQRRHAIYICRVYLGKLSVANINVMFYDIDDSPDEHFYVGPEMLRRKIIIIIFFHI